MGEKDETAETDPVADEAADETAVAPVEEAPDTGELVEDEAGQAVEELAADREEGLEAEGAGAADVTPEPVDPAPAADTARVSAGGEPQLPEPETDAGAVDPVPEAEPMRASAEAPAPADEVAVHEEAGSPAAHEQPADEQPMPAAGVEETAVEPASDATPAADEDMAARIVEVEAEPLQDVAEGGAIAAAFLRPENPDADGPGADTTIQYAKRVSRADRQDWGWWVDGDHLVESDGRGATRRTHLGDILEVQTAAAPAKFRSWRHQTILGLRDSRRIEIDNAHYVGVANYEERSESYAPFVRQLVDAIVRRAPYAKARRGASYLGYVAMLAFVFVLIALMAVLLFVLPIEGVPGIVFIKAGLIALMAPPLLAWVVKSRPSGMPLSQLPPGALPQAKP